jgi:acetyl esterase/lipase
MMVCPGGGYEMLAHHEGQPVAEWLNGLGLSSFVLKYRVAPRYHHPAPLEDAARAIRWVRSHAKQFGIDSHRIGILGFSAGGHLASSAGTHYDGGDPASADPVERVSSRPDFMVLIYPVISFGPHGHMGSCKNLLGESPPQELIDLMSSEKQVTPQTPPTFLVHGIGDDAVPCENSILFAQALRKADVPFELHLLDTKRHGLGMESDGTTWSTWPGICANWLRHRGYAR